MKDPKKFPSHSTEALIQSFFDNAPISIIIYQVKRNGISSQDYIIRRVNPRCLEVEGWNEEDVLGKTLGDVRPGVDEFGIIEIFQKVWKTGKTIHYPAKIYREGNQFKWFENTIFKLPTGEIVAIYEDVTQAKIKEKQIEYLSYRDSLTGVYNRNFFENELKHLEEREQLPITIIMADIDGLKLINDIFGHHMGDRALIKIAELFKASLRETDIISRWGGDEFVLLLPNTPEHIGQAICKRIKEECSKLYVADTQLSISLGCASKTSPNQSWQYLLKKAEDDMYKSKLLGAKSYRSVVLASMKKTLFEKSSETKEHGERLGYYCKKIGVSLGLSESQLNDLELLAMLHDIGKIAIDESILEKPGPLTVEEWIEMKKHPEVGYRIAQTAPELINIAEYILSHHERWDGKGYPRGLVGKDIPLLSRILAIVDAYDEMTNNRPYRKALPIHLAKQELEKNAGTQFDPEIVELFLTCLNSTS